MARVFCFYLGLWIVSFAAALSFALSCSAGEGGRHRRRNVLQSGSSRQSQLDWFRQADKDRRSWPELFSVDQDTRKEMIIGVVTENPWGTLCNSISECTS